MLSPCARGESVPGLSLWAGIPSGMGPDWWDVPWRRGECSIATLHIGAHGGEASEIHVSRQLPGRAFDGWIACRRSAWSCLHATLSQWSSDQKRGAGDRRGCTCVAATAVLGGPTIRDSAAVVRRTAAQREVQSVHTACRPLRRILLLVPPSARETLLT
jgi:hypothetical protein